MTSALDDHRARQHALDPGRSFIVQAPAGSGKTELLVRRFLVLLTTVSEPERIVAITFTRKAAAEMRARVVGALTLARQPRPTDPVAQELWHIGRAALAADERHGWQLQVYPARLRIQTIDALCATLTRQMPWLSRFGAPLRVIDDAEELFREAAIATVRRLGSTDAAQQSAITSLVTHLDNNLPRFADLLVEMLRHRDQWLRHVVRRTDDTDLRGTAERAWTDLIESELDALRAQIPQSLRATLVELTAFAAQTLTAAQANSPINACRGLHTLPAATADQLPQWHGLAELLLTRNGAWRRRVNIKLGFPPRSTQSGRMTGLLRDLSGTEGLRRRLAAIRGLPGARFTSQQWQVLRALIEVLPFAAAELKLVFRERGQVDFTEITERARAALGACDAPTELALRLDYRIDHLLVDEFQDTSVSQFELLQQLTAGWGGDSRTLFLVGDPMQSIYRFRDAEVGLFLHVMRHGWGSIPIRNLTLSVNFRAHRSLVNWVNRTFPPLFPAASEAHRGAVAYAPFVSRPDSREGPAIGIYPQPGGAEHEASQVIALVRAALDDPDSTTIAVLVRSRLHLQAILPALEAAGVEYQGVDIVPLAERPVIIDLMSLVRALIMPADRVAWLAILRAPWCGLTLEDLHILAGEANGSVMERLFDREYRLALSEDGRARADRVAAVIGRALAERGRGGFRDWIEDVWAALGGPACIDAAQLADAETFLALLSEHETGGDIGDVSRLQRAVARLWARPDPHSGERVQIMTLHKAKGLEFDTVIIPGLHRVPPAESSRLLVWEELQPEAQATLLLAPLAEPGAEPDPHYRYLRRLHAEKEEFETLRLLYVGCTRARRALHLLGSVRVDDDGELRNPDARSLLKRLWPQFASEFHRAVEGAGAPPAQPSVAIPASEEPAPLVRLARDWQPPRPLRLRAALTGANGADAPPAIEFAWAGETARQIGILVHSIMQWMGEDGLGDWDAERIDAHRSRWRGELRAAGVAPDRLEAALERTVAALNNVLADPRAVWILGDDHQVARNELQVTTYHDGSLRNLVIDRTFITHDGVRWIVDYKTSFHEGGGLDEFLDREVERYRVQLETYAAALAVEDDRPIRLGLYFPLLKGWREWAYRP